MVIVAASGLPTVDPSRAAPRSTQDDEAEMKVLIERARSLVPFVQAAEIERLKNYEADHAADVAAWSFRCERFGDFLSMYVTRRLRGDKTERVVKAVNVVRDSPIALVAGHAPDLTGEGHFNLAYKTDRSTGHDTKVIQFDGVVLPPPDDSWSYMTGNVAVFGGIVVSNVARSEVPDAVTFGDDSVHGGAITGWSSQQPPAPVTGFVLPVPAGLGHGVYDAIMKANAEGTR